MKRSDFQLIVDVINKEHDFYFEILTKDHDQDLKKDELKLRKFLLEAQKKGFNIKHSLYDWDYKSDTLDKLYTADAVKAKHRKEANK